MTIREQNAQDKKEAKIVFDVLKKIQTILKKYEGKKSIFNE